jgi:hypothetical protein
MAFADAGIWFSNLSYDRWIFRHLLMIIGACLIFALKENVWASPRRSSRSAWFIYLFRYVQFGVSASWPMAHEQLDLSCLLPRLPPPDLELRNGNLRSGMISMRLIDHSYVAFNFWA